MNFKQALQELTKYDVGRTSYFTVTINPSSSSPELRAILNQNAKPLSFLCYSAELPGEAIATADYKFYGVLEKTPIMASYQPITLGFYTRGSDYEIVRATLLNWLTYSTGRGESLHGSISNRTTYDVKYKSDISATIIITHYSVDGQVLQSCQLIDAFPIGIDSTKLDWFGMDSAMLLSATFTYTEYSYILDTTKTNTPNFLNNTITAQKSKPTYWPMLNFSVQQQ